jgi:hypothetical protein
VLTISIVRPFAARTMSPGRKAPPPGMFSAAATTATTLTGSPSAAIAPVPAITAAPPDMSPFIASIEAAGLIEIPPVSNVIALPTSPSVTSVRAPSGSQRITISRGSRALPCATAANAPMPSRSISDGPSASTTNPSIPKDAAWSARSSGASSFGGAFARSRARSIHSATRPARSAAASTPSPAITTRVISRAVSFDFQRPGRYAPYAIPSTAARACTSAGTPSPGSIAQPTVPPIRDAARATAAAAVRIESASGDDPTPTAATRAAGTSPFRCTTTVDPVSPLSSEIPSSRGLIRSSNRTRPAGRSPERRARRPRGLPARRRSPRCPSRPGMLPLATA